MQRLALLDYARLAAALAVMAFHYLFNGIVGGKITTLSLSPMADIAKYGYLGVELFFIISGYVIFYTARDKTPGQFATSRAVRLFPAFWASVLLTASVAFFWGGPKMSVTLPQVLVNLTMIPSVLDVPFVDGVYWTLLVELMFYFAVLVILMAGWRRHLGTIFLVWPMVMLGAWAANANNWPYLGGYFPFFAAGALFALMRERVTLWAFLSLLVCLFLCVTESAGRAAAFSLEEKGIAHSPVVVGCIVASFFVLMALQITPRGLALELPGSGLAGRLTYPIYLIHAHVGYMLLSRFATEANKAVVYPLVVLVVIGVAVLVHEFVERRAAGFWRMLFGRFVGRPLDAGYARRETAAP